MPLLIRIGMVVSLLFGVLFIAAAGDAAVSAIRPLVGASAPSFSEPPVSPSWGTTLASSFLAMAILGAASLGIAWGFFRERTWARHLVMVYWGVWGVAAFWASAAMGEPLRGVLRIVYYAICAALAFCYFYQFPGVREYYRQLASRQA